MKILLDTHAFLWFILDDPRLPEGIADIIASRQTIAFLSAASVWEMSIKAGLGRLTVRSGDLEGFVERHMVRNAFQPLPVLFHHATGVARLPDIHRDPFDRLLVAQAQAEGLPLVTGDGLIPRYPIQTMWTET